MSISHLWCVFIHIHIHLLHVISKAHNVHELRDPGDLPSEMIIDEPLLPPLRGMFRDLPFTYYNNSIELFICVINCSFWLLVFCVE